MDRLEIHQSKETDTFKDVVKVHEKILKNILRTKKYDIILLKYQDTETGKRKRKSVWLRTIDTYDEIRIKKFAKENKRKISAPDLWILMDDPIRNYFCVKPFESKDFTFEKIKKWQIFLKLDQKAEHSDPLIRHSFWMTLILGWLSITISIIAIELSVLLSGA